MNNFNITVNVGLTKTAVLRVNEWTEYLQSHQRSSYESFPSQQSQRKLV